MIDIRFSTTATNIAIDLYSTRSRSGTAAATATLTVQRSIGQFVLVSCPFWSR
jgi:hypothetical protein